MINIHKVVENLLGCRVSFSQEGEDILLDTYLKGKKNGFFIDVGAHDPVVYSNTFRFYRRGWKGINIDANPDCVKKFVKVRPRDITLGIGIADCEGTCMFYRFREPALSTFDEKLSGFYQRIGHQLIDRIKVRTYKLADILDKYLPKDVDKIDFLSIDVEGYDLRVLKSNDWEKYRPYYIVVEVPGEDMKDLECCVESDTVKYLKEKKYLLISKLHNSLIFRINT